MGMDFRPFRLQPPDCSIDRFLTLPLSVDGFRIAPVLGFATRMQARQSIRPNRVHLRCGPAVRLTMLPTSPCGDAVSFGYRTENVSLKRTFTSHSIHTCQRTFLSLRDPAQSGRATRSRCLICRFCSFRIRPDPRHRRHPRFLPVNCRLSFTFIAARQ